AISFSQDQEFVLMTEVARVNLVRSICTFCTDRGNDAVDFLPVNHETRVTSQGRCPFVDPPDSAPEWGLFDTYSWVMQALLLQSRLYVVSNALADSAHIVTICTEGLDVSRALSALFKDFKGLDTYLKEHGNTLYLYAPQTEASPNLPVPVYHLF